MGGRGRERDAVLSTDSRWPVCMACLSPTVHIIAKYFMIYYERRSKEKKDEDQRENERKLSLKYCDSTEWMSSLLQELVYRLPAYELNSQNRKLTIGYNS